MSSRFGPPSRRVWTLQGGSATGDAAPGQSVITGAGNSGNWPGPPPWADQNQFSHMTAVDLRDVNDIALMVAVEAVTGTPSLAVNLDLYDDQGNLFAAAVTTGALTPTGPLAKAVYAGSHGGSASYLILPDWGRVSWTCTGGTCTGTQISLWAR
jgi:hypothetical protein